MSITLYAAFVVHNNPNPRSDRDIARSKLDRPDADGRLSRRRSRRL
ncbi:MAG: hypothetical protein MZU97_25290 [Bacillus subtilis]|nr:hypothetical protein [Bacillus subtilis]